MSSKLIVMTVGGMQPPSDSDTEPDTDRLEHALKRLQGVITVEIGDRGNVSVTVTDSTEVQQIRDTVTGLGFTANIK